MFLFTFWIDSWHYVLTGLATVDKEDLFMFWESKQICGFFFWNFFWKFESKKKIAKMLILGFCLHFESTADMNYELCDTLWKIENSGATLSKALFSTTCRLKALLRYCLSSSFFLGLLLSRLKEERYYRNLLWIWWALLLLLLQFLRKWDWGWHKSTLWSHVSWEKLFFCLFFVYFGRCTQEKKVYVGIVVSLHF